MEGDIAGHSVIYYTRSISFRGEVLRIVPEIVPLEGNTSTKSGWVKV